METGLELLGFQQRFMRKSMRASIRTAALSIPRGNGKSTLAGWIAARELERAEPHQEICVVAASLEQGRIVHKATRHFLGEDAGYVYQDSTVKVGIRAPNNAKLRVLGANGKTAMGLVNVPLVIGDEPGSWQLRDGELMRDAVETAQGKPGSALRVLYIGTLAPQGIPGTWWGDMIDAGSTGSVYVQALRGDVKKWDKASEIRRCNPLMWKYADSRKVLFDERDAARRDSRLRARFKSYRLNVPTSDSAVMLLKPEDWDSVLSRDVAQRTGQPIVGVDLGGGRSWSSAVALWPSGRIEAVAVCPGIPGLDAQEKRDRVPRGLYRSLAAGGRLRVAEGLRIPPVGMLVDMAVSEWGTPKVIISDRFRLPDLKDAIPPCPLSPRVTRWSEAGADIRDLRKLALDGPLSCEPASRDLVTASLAVAMVRNDDQGNCRLVKKTSDNSARDDVAAALVLAAGALGRWQRARGGKTSVVVV